MAVILTLHEEGRASYVQIDVDRITMFRQH
jgi:hypothetical protein